MSFDALGARPTRTKGAQDVEVRPPFKLKTR